MIKRLSIRTRPSGCRSMYQTWGKLLFCIGPLRRASATADRLRAAPRHLRGPGLGERVAFTMWGLRPIFFPPLPVLSQSHELNVRTYVHVEVCQGLVLLARCLDALAVLRSTPVLGPPYFSGAHALAGAPC